MAAFNEELRHGKQVLAALFSENVLVGSFIGDGEYLYFSGKSGQFFTVFDGEVEEYDSFDSVLTSISVDLEEKAEEIFGEDWLEEFEE